VSPPDRVAGPWARSTGGVYRSVHPSRDRSHTPSRPKPAGVSSCLLSGIHTVTGRGRHLAEQVVDGQALFAPRGSLPPACDRERDRDSPRSVAGAARVRRHRDERKVVKVPGRLFPPFGRKPFVLPTFRILSDFASGVNPFFSEGEKRLSTLLEVTREQAPIRSRAVR
jgi:hypothetical protein